MSPDPIPTSLWNQINKFPKVYYLQGSPTKINDLERACIHKALALVILSKQNETEGQQTGMVDADTIFLYRTVKLMNPTIQIITELAQINTISFLSAQKNKFIQKFGYLVSEPFASGEVYISTMLDTLMCQAYYNPYIINILNQLIMGDAAYTKQKTAIQDLIQLQQGNLFLIPLLPQF